MIGPMIGAVWSEAVGESMRLASLAAAEDIHLTIEQVDAMLTELQSMPRDEKVVKFVDDLLDYRSVLMTHCMPCARSASGVRHGSSNVVGAVQSWIRRSFATGAHWPGFPYPR
jgi:hypothetical protein